MREAAVGVLAPDAERTAAVLRAVEAGRAGTAAPRGVEDDARAQRQGRRGVEEDARDVAPRDVGQLVLSSLLTGVSTP